MPERSSFFILCLLLLFTGLFIRAWNFDCRSFTVLKLIEVFEALILVPCEDSISFEAFTMTDHVVYLKFRGDFKLVYMLHLDIIKRLIFRLLGAEFFISIRKFRMIVVDNIVYHFVNAKFWLKPERVWVNCICRVSICSFIDPFKEIVVTLLARTITGLGLIW